MRQIALTAIIAAPLLLAGCGEVESKPVPLTEKQQMRLDKELAGRVDGEPRNCISGHGNDGLVRISDSQLLYKPGGRTVYLNTLRSSCPGLARDNDIIVTQSYSGQLCSGDLVKLVDRMSGMPGPFCSLGEFVPYSKPKKG